MPTISDVLHDAVDAQEDLRQRAREITEAVIRDRLSEALRIGGQDINVVLEVLAVWVGEALTDITTEAVRKGAEFAAKRVAT